MKKFKDTQDRDWIVTIHVDAIKRVRSELDIDLSKALEENFTGLTAILADPVQLVEVLFVLCREQAQAAGISDEDFGKSMGGDCLLTGGEAFVEALIDFFPHARARASLTALLAKGKTVRNVLLERAEEQIKALDPNQIAESMLPGSSGNSPASAESTPAP